MDEKALLNVENYLYLNADVANIMWKSPRQKGIEKKRT